MYWACTNLSTLPDPTKPVWEQEAKALEVLMTVERVLMREAGKGGKKS